MLATGMLLGLAAYLVVIVKRSLFRVEEGHLGVLVSFGAAVTDGKILRTYPPGLHRKWPWQRAVVVAVMEQNLDLSGQDGGRIAMAEDGTVLRFDSILRYVPLEAELHTFLFGMERPLEHITWLFTCLLRNEIANFRASDERAGDEDFLESTGSYAVIRRERRRLNQRIELEASAQIGSRCGIRFLAVDLTDVLPPDELHQALNAVIEARADVRAEYFRAEAESQKRVLAAERGVQIAAGRASAAQTEIARIADFLVTLREAGTLQLYVARRRAEVLSEARTLYFKEVLP